MSGHCSIPHPLKREGTYQWQRFPEGLKKDFFKPDDRTTEQLVEQVSRYAATVRYYDTTLNEWGRWETFFEFLFDSSNKKIKFANIDVLLKDAGTPPHLGLLLSFLKSFQVTRDEFNGFTNRHVDFYYKDVLQLSPKPAVPDSVAVLLEPEKNTIQAKVEEGRELSAGKDGTGVDLVYKTNREIIVNQAIIAAKKTIYADNVENDAKTDLKGLYLSKEAATDNSFVQNNITSWYPFGDNSNPRADVGFAISSPMLLAKEGRRRLSLEIDGGQNISRSALTAFYTGPKGWVQAEVDLLPGVNNNSSSTSKTFLLVKIDDSLPAVVAYNEKIHLSGYTSIYPVVKILLKNEDEFEETFAFFAGLKFSAFNKMVMNVEGVKSFTLSGENGKLSPLQAFKPFGNIPVKNKSFFTIGHSEAFNKYLNTFHLAANWKNAPGNMTKYYHTYHEYLNNIAKNDRNSPVGTETIASFKKQWEHFDQGNVPGKLELLSGGKWVLIEEDKPDNYTARKKGTYNTFHANNKVKDDFDITNNSEYTTDSRWGFARVNLKYDFGHQLYPLVLSFNVMNNVLNNKTVVVPTPYIPEFNSLHLDYVLQDHFNFDTKPEHQFMQIHPFGFVNVSSDEDVVISPDYNNNGQLFIGVSGCTSPQIINLYIARLDGTEDIDALIREEIQWSYLAGDVWTPFRYEEIIVNTTHDFTASGFISFTIPQAALHSNTLMGENMLWIKAVSATSYNAFPSIIDIHTNAVEAEFDDRGNDPYHLQTPLGAGLITKPLIKIDGVKKASQPYASYGGAMAEQSDQFYTRTSERLRHKNRSWNIWDYERLMLDKFPAIFKLKCISHATMDDMFVPGHVLCVVLPSITNLAEKDLLQPRISKAVLTEAQEFISGLTTTFAHVEFINPVYEPITVKCSVKMKAGYDESYYTTQLNIELQQYISPWILNNGVSPSFGGKIYASGIINFIEEREYVDYITFFEAYKLENDILVTWKEFTTGSSEDVIMTSAAQHEIDTQAIC